jgi:DDE superfamily endonuclease
MEDILDQYARPYDLRWPLLCYDERPCQLLGDVLVPLPMDPGHPQRVDYEYERHGTCCVLLAFEPQTGFRYVQVRTQRTAEDYAHFLWDLVQRHYPEVERIRLVQDNLNTHTPGSFYHVWAPAKAFAFAQRFELHYTPRKGSWLNMAEIEFAALAKQCLDRRIPNQTLLEKEVLAWARARNRARKTVQWTFTQPRAREKLKSQYSMIKN